ncbi:UNVERIFIED_ORG: hypothetical protein M2193_000060 [Bradyrhizobium japonicum]
MIALKLDASAIGALFKDKDEVKLELQQAVVAEITKRMFDKYVPVDVRNLIDAVFEAQRNELIEAVKDDVTFQARFTALFEKEVCNIKASWGNKTYNVTPAMKEKLNDAIKTQVDLILAEAKLRGGQLVTELVEQTFKRLHEGTLADVDKLISRKISAITNEEIDRRVQAALETALKVAKA